MAWLQFHDRLLSLPDQASQERRASKCHIRHDRLVSNRCLRGVVIFNEPRVPLFLFLFDVFLPFVCGHEHVVFVLAMLMPTPNTTILLAWPLAVGHEWVLFNFFLFASAR